MNELARIAQWIQKTPSLFADSAPVIQSCPVQNVDLDWPDQYQGNPRLGFLYQYILSQLFSNSNNYQLMAEEIQLSAEGRTLGAIDFIVKNLVNSHVEHWEVAIKFYLLYQGHWYGPNAKDRLDLKLTKMLDHQLKMSSSSAFLKRYPEWSNISEHLLMQGRLYINPFDNHPIPKACLTQTLNPSRIKGYWCFQHQQHLIDEALFPLHKHQWITGLAATNNSVLKEDIPEINRRAHHFQSVSGQYWFIVPNSWPNRTLT